MEWLGQAKIQFTSAPKTIPLKRKDGTSTNLLNICREATPPCWLNPLLFNGHLQTMYTSVKKRSPSVYYKRKIFDAEDPTYHGTFSVDFAVEPFSGSDETLPPRTVYFGDEEFQDIGSLDKRPMLVALHGLSGGSYESYLTNVLALLKSTEVDGLPWEACVINSRGCANHKITSPVFYNARTTWDYRQTITWLRQTFPNRPLFGIGFSLGANMLTNYLAEEGDSCILQAAVVCSSPWNCEASNLSLGRTWLGREVYLKVMGGNMKRIVEQQYDTLKANPDINWERFRTVKYLFDFDREIQCPVWGYPTTGAYYRDASSVDALFGVKTPLFILSALDDPIVPGDILPFEEVKQTPYAVLCTTSMGGHLGWYETSGLRWHPRPIVNFLNKMVSEVQMDSTPSSNEGLVKEEQPMALAKRFDPLRRKWAL
ncbi:Alpha/Beta hydrolase protein [Xylogone sp. PMI_703]|nr:Alpha/Beta hydrolase protein [Xylogone sp. PMI_703]